MMDLTNSGLQLKFDKIKKRMIFGKFIPKVKPSVRHLNDMKEVLLDKNLPDRELYYMYRNIYFLAHRELFQKFKIRYDITIIPPAKLGREFVKTAGHYHPLIPKQKFSYTEIYEVLHGEAHYLLQKSEDIKKNDKIVDIVVIKAKQGDKVIVPPNYGHITINPTRKVLIMANLVSSEFNSNYKPIKDKHGAAYFELKNRQWIKNDNYAEIPELRKIHSKPTLGKEPMYNLFTKQPDKFKFLSEPQNYLDICQKPSVRD